MAEAPSLRLPGPTEVSPWFELVRWNQYLQDYQPAALVALSACPNPETEPQLEIICQSLERVVEAAHRNIRDDKINFFDQLRVNSFLSSGKLYNRPLE